MIQVLRSVRQVSGAEQAAVKSVKRAAATTRVGEVRRLDAAREASVRNDRARGGQSKGPFLRFRGLFLNSPLYVALVSTPPALLNTPFPRRGDRDVRAFKP